MIEIKLPRCINCGGEMRKLDEHLLECKHCGSLFDDHALEQESAFLQKSADQTSVADLRRRLYDAVCAKHVSKKEVLRCATALKQHLPDDFQVNFYLEALSGDAAKISRLLREIDEDEHYEQLRPIFRFLTASLESEFLLELKLLVERAYKKRDPALFAQTMHSISEEAERVLPDVYEAAQPRDVFISYSPKDIAVVSELCEAFEDDGFSCFVEARNLRHGVSAAEQDAALREAMDNCFCILFISTVNSRKFDCNAIRKVFPYVKDEDIRNAPVEFRSHYSKIPKKYKKPRIEYRVGSVAKSRTDTVTNEFFDGYECVYDATDVIDRLVQLLTSTPEDTASEDVAPLSTGCQHMIVKTPGNPPTCTEKGSTESEICSVCGEVLKKPESIPATGHTFGDWHTTKPATCTEDGEQVRICACGERETNQIPSRGGHVPSAWETVKEPAPGAEGLRTKKCIVCGKEIAQESIPALPARNTGPSQGLAYEKDEDSKTCTVIGQGTCKDKDIRIPEEIDGYRVTRIDTRTINDEDRSVSGFDKDITSVVIPDSVTKIDSCAFHGCTSLASVIIPDSVTEIDAIAFSGVQKLKVSSDNPNYCSVDGNLYTKDRQMLLQCGSKVTEFRIPDSVTSVGEFAFYGCTRLASVIIPDSVTEIHHFAFAECTSLASVVIPDSVTSIDYNTFEGCTSLTSVKVPDFVISIGYDAFKGCTRLASVEIPTSVTKIKNNAFTGVGRVEVASDNPSYCSADGNLYTKDRKMLLHYDATSKATEFRIPGSVTDIGDSAFSGCTSLVGVVIPDSVTSIGKYAFSGCTSLVGVVIPDSVISIGYGAFRGCTSLTGVTIPKSVTKIDNSAFTGVGKVEVSFDNPRYCSANGNLYTKDRKTLLHYDATSKATEFRIPGSVTDIGDSAFDGCTSLVSVVIPDSVTSIGSFAFFGCTSLASVVLPNTIAKIEMSVFYGCTSLASVVIPDSVTCISDGAFGGCTSLENLVIPDSVTSIYTGVFDGCTSLTSVNIPDLVSEICWRTFANCTSLVSLVIPDSVTSIHYCAFDGCTSLSSIRYTGPKERWDRITAKISAIPPSVKIQCTPQCDLPDPTQSVGLAYRIDTRGMTCTVIGQGTCKDKDILIPKSIDGYRVTGIGAETKNDSGDLTSGFDKDITSVDIPRSVTSIDNGAFNGCTSLVSIKIPNSVKSIDGFRDCTSLASVVIGNSVTRIGYSAFRGCTSLTSVVIPNSVKSIGGFHGCTSLVSVVIPDSVTTIDSFTFYGCTSLVSVVIPDSVTTIDSYTFCGCKSLTSVVIPDSVTTIGDSAFDGCTSLTSMVIPHSVTSIGNNAFYGCKSLASVVIPDSVATIGNNAFYGCKSLASVVIPNSVTTIGDSAFWDCESLTSVVIPHSVTSIGDRAFWGCTSLTSVVIPDSVTSIGNHAFSWCRSLTSIVIPDSVTSIGDSAFCGCTSLTSLRYAGTKKQWKKISFGKDWNKHFNICSVECADKIMELK